MKSFRYNLLLLGANSLFALNFSLFVSVMEQRALSLGAIFVLQNLCFVAVVGAWRASHKVVRTTLDLRGLLAIVAIAALSSLGWSYTTLWGMALTSPIDAATIASAGPSLTLIFAHFMRRRRLTPARLVGVAISLLAVVMLVVSSGELALRGVGAWGNLLLTVAMTIAALNTLLLKPLLERYGIQQVAWVYALTAAVVSLPLFWGEIELGVFETLNMASLLEIVMLLLLGGATPLLMLFEGTEYLSPLHTSLYRYVQPFVTSAVVLMRGQARLNAINYIALFVIVIGATLMARGVDRAE